MDFSFIIVNFKTEELTVACLDSLIKNIRGDFEIIVVDNDAEGRSSVLQDEFGSRVKFIVNRDNVGFGRANNQAANIAQGKYLFFLNSDTLVDTDIVVPIKAAFNNPQTVIVAPRLVMSDGSLQEHACGKFPSLLGLFSSKLGRIKAACDWVSGAALAVRKDFFDKIGGFDEGYFMYFEDVDLCYQAHRAGYEVRIIPEARVVHLGGKSITDDSMRKRFYYQSQNYFFRKNYGLFSEILLNLLRLPYVFINRSARTERRASE
jgi:N-acetylglucosaminyl-diphospho-decaprenol L-rhamnosyltransferase